MKSILIAALGAALSAGATGCAALDLPPALAGKAEVLADTDPDYAKGGLGSAVLPAGQGGISEGLVVRLTEDLPVYRMWSGPDKLNASGFTNRIGQWWAYDAPTGTQAAYRDHYDICLAWNDLTWVATCTLKAGSVVAIGPGQSVSAETCGDPTGQESYPANPDYWQTYVAKAWARADELQCPADSADYQADPEDISRAVAQ